MGKEVARPADEAPRYPSDARKEGLIVGNGEKRYGYPERKVRGLVPQEFRSGDCDGDGY